MVTAPYVLGSAVMLNQQCLYELTIAQVVDKSDAARWDFAARSKRWQAVT